MRVLRARAKPYAELLTALVGGALLSTMVPAPSAAQGMPPSLARFVQESIGLSVDQLGDANSGKPVLKTLETPDRLEIAIFGMVSIDVPRSFYIRRATDFPSALRDPSRLHFAVFSDPAIPSDVSGFSLPHADVQELASCRPGACRIKLSAQAMARAQAVIDLTSPSADSVRRQRVHPRADPGLCHRLSRARGQRSDRVRRLSVSGCRGPGV
jgi:hypothetical protein